MKVVLLDIEGTTTSISFVYDVLFPYARRALPGFLASHWGDPAVREAAALMGGGDSPEAAAQRALALMDADVKDTGLKALQGLVWEGGYRAGELRGHVFPDVAPALRELTARGVRVAIYSSGSVAAQRLLFGHSEAGDLTPLISGYFDTTTGPKKDAASYRAIAEALAVEPGEILFATDHPDEARAALMAGLAARLAERPGNAPWPEGGLPCPVIRSLSELVAPSA